MNIANIVLKLILSLIFIPVGIIKLMWPLERLGVVLGWVNGYSRLFIQALGLLELALGGMLLASIFFKAMPIGVSKYSALAIAAIMLGACVVHVLRGEYSMMVFNVLILLAAAFVAYNSIG